MTDQKKPKLTFVTFEHPTEKLLIRVTLFADQKIAYQQPWHRCRGDDGKLCAPTAAFGIKKGQFIVEDLGVVAEPPSLRVDVCGSAPHLRGTQGAIHDDGISIEWGGACPIQGEGGVDGRTLYYRARGASWSVDIAVNSEDEFIHHESPYIWPDGGWLKAEESERNIRLGVAKWREHTAKKGASSDD